jgi:8-oxo-dGTP diphosphatase
MLSAFGLGPPKMGCKWIHKVGLAAMDGERLLVVRKRSGGPFILPGGKPEREENELATLAREIEEELGCSIEDACPVGVFKDKAAGDDDAVVVVRLYLARLVGEPRPQSEIGEIAWLNIAQPSTLPLAPSIINRIVPFLQKRLRQTRRTGKSRTKIADKRVQGFLEFA